MALQCINNFSVTDWIRSWFDDGLFSRTDRLSWINSCMVTMWCIWKHRCEVVFEAIQVDVEIVVRRIQYCLTTATLTLTTSVRSVSYHATLPTNHALCYWKPSCFGIVKVNVDGAFDYANGHCGIGVVLRDYTGGFLGGGACGGMASSPEEAKGLAALQGVKWAISRGYDQILLKGDTLLIINFLKYGTGNIGLRTKSCLLEVMDRVNDFSFFYCNYVPRSCNNCADILAAFGLNQSIEDPQWWDEDPPTMILERLHLEGYTRAKNTYC